MRDLHHQLFIGEVMAEEYKSLKRMLRNRASQEYFTGQGWHGNACEAKVFPDQFEAVRTCIDLGLKDVELVLRFEKSGADLFSTVIC